MLDLYGLQVFLLAAKTENFSETARLLNISQPAVSGHIQSLEQQLQTRLFDRTGRNIRLNEVGSAFVPVVHNLLKEARQAEAFIASRRGTISGHVTIGCSTACGKYILPRVIARFLAQNSDARVTCWVGQRGAALDSLAAGEVDLAVSSLRVPGRDFEYRHFSDDLLVLIVPPDHPWAARENLEPDDLVEYPFVMREPASGTVVTLNRALARYDMSVDVLSSRLVLANTESIVQAVCAGVGPAFVSQVAAESVLEKGLVRAVAVPGLDLVMRLYMVRHTRLYASDAQRAFWDFTFAPENHELLLLPDSVQ
ncbi:MAG: LysR family transcriptional regulator [Anaerolineae bacterium]|mgnify:CR=1 FL=1|nr:LysR family transcriptional regulator [Anaerolineae bacterium]MEB2289401.1 LysR family transcriptional regulator [Anaerolineae bacterium]